MWITRQGGRSLGCLPACTPVSSVLTNTHSGAILDRFDSDHAIRLKFTRVIHFHKERCMLSISEKRIIKGVCYYPWLAVLEIIRPDDLNAEDYERFRDAEKRMKFLRTEMRKVIDSL